MRTLPVFPALLALILLAPLAPPATAQETTLQNDGFVDGQAVGFQGGFVADEIAASRFTPTGTGPWRLNRVRFLFGGSTSTVTFTLRVYADAAGTNAPGAELYSGDYQVTGSDVLLQEIDLTSENVTVTGTFRVGIEFQHNGAPSVARDGDGTINASRNFIYTPSIPGWFQSNLFGLSGDWVIRAVVQPTSGGTPGAPSILTIHDVGGDQGGQVRLRFARSSRDTVGSMTPVLSYEVHRRVGANALVAGEPWGPSIALRPHAQPDAVMLDGWDYVMSVPAHGDAIYSVVVPTLVDSSIAQGMRRSTFFVRATTATPTTVFDSPADSGYSVDNLPPAPPAAFAATYSGGTTHLTWNPNAESDLWYYALHRGASAGFTPTAGNRVATTGALGHDDVGPAGSYYKLAAIDVHGNVSGYTLIAPATLDVMGGEARLALAVQGAHPARTDRLRFAITLPSAAAAQLELLDVHGRRVAGETLGVLGAGRHSIALTPASALRAGVYVARLTQGSESRSVRVVAVD